MGHYKSNVRDLEFNLFEVLELEKALATGDFGDLDGESVRQMLAEAARLAEGPLAEAFADADRNPPTFDPATHVVTIPESFKKSLRAWQQGEWFRVGLAEDIGGVPAPAMVAWSINEFALGAQPAAFIYLAGPIMADILYQIGNEDQRRLASLAMERNWAATMVLTEPDAGSDVGAGRTKAVQQADGTWHIDGVKRFITNGDTDDLFENILHLVLARPEGAGPGTKGLSLFVVPKFLPDRQTGDPGERNGVYVTGLEHKMGLKASATCELTFGQHGAPAVGWLVGDIAQRHRADVQDHRVRPNDGRHQGDCDPVDRISERLGLREDPGAGRRHDADDRQDRAAGHDLASPGCAPRADDTEGLRRGAAGAVPVHRRTSGSCGGRDRVGGRCRACRTGQRSAAADRQGRRLRACLSVPDRVVADVRRIGVPAGLSDRAVHPRRQDRQPLRGHDRNPGPGLLLPQDRTRSGRRAAARRHPDPETSSTATRRGRNWPTVARCSPPRSPTRRR